MSDVAVLNDSEAGRVNHTADMLGFSRDDLRIKVCQLKSFLAENKQKALELKATMMENVRENFANASSFMKLIYGLTGIVSLAFAFEVAAGGTALALFAIGAVCLFIGGAELVRFLKEGWNRLKAKLDEAISL